MKKTTTKKPTKAKNSYTPRVQKLELVVQALQEAVRGVESNLVSDVVGLEKKIENLEKRIPPTATTQQKENVLTDADWKRIVAEGYLCEFGSREEGWEDVGVLTARDRDGLFSLLATNGSRRDWRLCRPLNKPGVMQPYFGQGMPVPRHTRVIVKNKDGSYKIQEAENLNWDKHTVYPDSHIIAYMILP